MKEIEMIRCVHKNGKPCMLPKKATEDRNFMKKYELRVEHVSKELPKEKEKPTEPQDPDLSNLNITDPEEEAAAVDAQISEALAESVSANIAHTEKPTRKPRTTKKPTRK